MLHIMSHVACKWVMSHMNGSCHVWMSHVTYEWGMSHMNESCHIWMSHFTYEWVMSHMNESCHIRMSHVTYEWVMSHMNESFHIWMSHVTYEWVMLHMNESRHIWVMCHVTYEDRVCVCCGCKKRVISHMNSSRHVWMSREWVTSWTSRVTYERESVCVLRMGSMSHVTYVWVISHECVMPHIYEWCYVRVMSRM